MVAPHPRGLAVPQTTALTGTLLLALITLIGFLEKPPTATSAVLAVAFLGLSALSGWRPKWAGLGLGVLLVLALAVPAEDSFAVFAVLTPITVLGLSKQRQLRIVLALWYFAGLVALIHLRNPGVDSLVEDLSTILFVAVLLLGSWLLGSAIHALARMREHAHLAAVRGVRVAVAQDLHDTVAHSLSLIAMRSDQARLAGEGTPDDLAFIADHSRQAIQDLRGMLEMLRRDPEMHLTPDSGTPWQLETLASTLTQRCAALEAQGFSVSALTEGDLTSLQRSVDRTLARVLHEALSNVERHAEPRSHCSVLITVQEDVAQLAVVSVRPTAGSLNPFIRRPGAHLGIVGMKERLEGCNGTLEIGPVGDRWIVEATVPLARTRSTRIPGRS